MLHFALIIFFVIVIIIIQFVVFGKTNTRISVFTKIFPDDSTAEFKLISDSDGVGSIIISKAVYENSINDWNKECDTLKKKVDTQKKFLKKLESLQEFDTSGEYDSQISEARANLDILKDQLKKLKECQPVTFKSYKSLNSIRNTIISSINNYLDKNKRSTSTDFQLVKDIVDRNSDAEEDAIQAQIPVPLYCGLMGTMLGIIVGILYLWLSGDLDALLGSQNATGTGAAGIEALLGGVALAMISSIFGIILTTIGSWIAKKSKSDVEAKKHLFLSWLQAELLPVMNTDAAAAINQLVDNLNEFNNAFETNTKELTGTLSKVSDTSRDQAKLLEAINDLKIEKIVSANVEVYEKLKNSSEEIGKIGVYFSQIGDYLSVVNSLSEKLDTADSRIKCIENMGQFFIEERSKIENIQHLISKPITDADNFNSQIVSELKSNLEKRRDDLNVYLTQYNDSIKKLFAEQDKFIQDRSGDLSSVVTEINQLSEVKKIMDRLAKATEEQNKKVELLLGKLSSKSYEVHGTDTHHGSAYDDLRVIPVWVKICGGVFLLWMNGWMIVMLLKSLSVF